MNAFDEALALRDDSRKVMAGLESKYAEVSGVKALKVRHNNILGYFIEVTAAKRQAVDGTASFRAVPASPDDGERGALHKRLS